MYIKRALEKEKKNHPYSSRKEIFEDIYKGGMPEYIAKNINRDRFFNSYGTTYIEKDVKKSHFFF